MKPPSPLTRFLEDLIRVDQKQMTMTELHDRWKQGQYRGVSNDDAAGYVRLFKEQKGMK